MRHCLPVCSLLWKRTARSRRPQPSSEILRQPSGAGGALPERHKNSCCHYVARSSAGSPTLSAQYTLQPCISFFDLRCRKPLLEPRPDLFAPCDEISRLSAGAAQLDSQSLHLTEQLAKLQEQIAAKQEEL